MRAGRDRERSVRSFATAPDARDTAARDTAADRASVRVGSRLRVFFSETVNPGTLSERRVVGPDRSRSTGELGARSKRRRVPVPVAFARPSVNLPETIPLTTRPMDGWMDGCDGWMDATDG